MENGHSPQKQEAKSSRADPEGNSANGQTVDAIVQDVLQNNELGREAPTSKVGYGGCGGDLPCPTDQSEIHRRQIKFGTPGPQCYLEEEKGAVNSNGYGHDDYGEKSEVTKNIPYLNVPGDHHGEDRLSKDGVVGNGECIPGTEEKPKKSVRLKLKEMLPGHHDHKHADNGTEDEPVDISNDEETHGLFSKLKHKVVENHDKHMDEPNRKVFE